MNGLVPLVLTAALLWLILRVCLTSVRANILGRGVIALAALIVWTAVLLKLDGLNTEQPVAVPHRAPVSVPIMNDLP
jgi:hypothetical protein